MLLRGTNGEGVPCYVPATKVIAIEALNPEWSCVKDGTYSGCHVLLEGRETALYFQEPVEVVAGALCEALKYVETQRNN